MPLFMLLAGQGASLSLARRSAGEYLRRRLVRLALPLAAGTLLLVPPQVWVERRARGEFAGSLASFYPRFFDGLYPSGNFGWHHLWFLWFLLAFSVATLPLLQWLRAPRGRALVARWGARCAARGGLVWLVLPAAALRAGTAFAFPRVPALGGDWSNRVLLLPAFLLGFALSEDDGIQRAIDRHWRTALALAVAGSAALGAWAWPGDALARLPSPRSSAGVLLGAAYGAGACCWVVALVGVARRHLRRRREAVARADAMAYPFYLLHQPVVVAVAAVVAPDAAEPWRAFLLVAGASLAVTCGLVAALATHDLPRALFGLHPAARGGAGCDG
jgi:peptidoglycan/LPS O-acetylase OafA/YrhL